MPRRLITSSIFINEKFGALNDPERLLFIGLFSNADDDGRIKGSPSYLKALIFPYDNLKSATDVEKFRDKCTELKLITTYNVNGYIYIQVIGWGEHQVIRSDRYKKSTIPAPTDNQKETTRQPTDNQEDDTCPSTDDPNPIQSNTIQSNKKGATSNEVRTTKPLKLKRTAPSLEKSTLGENTKIVFGLLDKERGYRPTKRKAEAASIMRMLKTYTPDQIMNAWKLLKQDKFWEGKELFMMTVESQIGAILNSKNPSSHISEKYGRSVTK